MIQDTSLEAYRGIVATVRGRQAEVLRTFGGSADGLAAHEIAEVLREPKAWVMPRITELKKLGLVVKSMDRRVDPSTGKSGIVWRRSYPDGQQQTINYVTA